MLVAVDMVDCMDTMMVVAVVVVGDKWVRMVVSRNMDALIVAVVVFSFVTGIHMVCVR